MKCSVSTKDGCRWEAVQPWLVCFSASLFFFYQFIQGNMFASLGDHVMRDFGIQADKMIYLSSIYYFANVAFLLGAGIVLDRFSIKRTLVLSMLICVISTFFLAYAQSFYVALACRFIAGVTSAFCFLGPIRLASRWFPPKKMALITGAIVTMAMCGGLVAQYPITKLALHVGWREAVLNVAWLGVLIFAMMLWWIQERPKGHKDPVHKILPMWTTWKACLSRQPIFAGLYTSLMNLPIAVLGAAMGKLYLMQRLGATQAEASWVNGMLFFGAMLGGPLFGFFSDKLGRRLFPMKLGALFSLLTVLCILYAPVSAGLMAVLFFLLGLVTAAQVISYVLVAESSLPVMVATALSVVSLFTQGGYLVYQNIFSKILVKCGGVELIGGTPVYPLASYQTAALILPAAFLISLLLAFGLKETFAKPHHG
jgi:MFS family permease